MTSLLLLLLSAPAYPPLPPTDADKDQLGRGVQRTMSLLAASTADKPSRVRILFYGQSITEQDWWRAVVLDLRKRFPTAQIDAQNRAIGGFSSQRLVLTAEHDLYPFDPDLLIFHVYGAHDKYEEIIRNVRTRTAAEVLMQRDHLAKWPPAEIDEKQDKGAWWDHFMNETHLPAVAKKYDCGLVDVRGRWIDYLKAHKLEPPALLKDAIHLNDHGNFVMAAIVSRYLVHRPELKEDQRLVKEFVVGTDVKWDDNKLMVPFTGYRVDVVGAHHYIISNSHIAAQIDGRRPSEIPDCRWIGRPDPHPWSRVFLMRIGHTAPLEEETWSLVVTDVAEDGKKWSFTVLRNHDTVDGTGSSDQPYKSPTGRATIDPAHWQVNGKPHVGYRVSWKVNRTAQDRLYDAPVQTVAAGLPNGPHTLTLTRVLGGGPSVRAVRVYTPPFPKSEGAKP